jgi:hypothetical protein
METNKPKLCATKSYFAGLSGIASAMRCKVSAVVAGKLAW